MGCVAWRTEAELCDGDVEAALRTYFPCDFDAPRTPSHYLLSRAVTKTGRAFAPRAIEAGADIRVGDVVLSVPHLSVQYAPTLVESRWLVLCMGEGLFERTTGLCEWDRGDLHACLNLSSDFLRSVMSRLEAEVRSPGFASAALLGCLAHMAMIEVSARLREPRRADPGVSRLEPWQMERIRERANDLQQAPGVNELADLCGLSRHQLIRQFKTTIGMTPYRYVQEERVSRAKSLLDASDLPMKQIAGRLGFSSASHFSSAFRRVAGMTPNAYRAARR